MKIIAHSSHPGMPDRITIEVGGEVFTVNSTPSPVAVGGWHVPYVNDERRNAIEAPMISAARCWRAETRLTDGPNDLHLSEMLERQREMRVFMHPAMPRNGVWVSMATIMEIGLDVA